MNFGRREWFAENWSESVLANATQELWTLTVPNKCECEITEFGNYLGTVAAWGTNYWYATANGVAFELAGGFPYIYDQVGYAAQRQSISPKRFAGGTHIQIFGVEGTGAAVDMGISIGYFLIYQE